MEMKALQKTAEGMGHVELCDVPIPEIGPSEVLMKVYAAGVCGSDLLIQEDRHFYKATSFPALRTRWARTSPVSERAINSSPTSSAAKGRGWA